MLDCSSLKVAKSPGLDLDPSLSLSLKNVNEQRGVTLPRASPEMIPGSRTERKMFPFDKSAGDDNERASESLLYYVINEALRIMCTSALVTKLG